MGSAVKGFKDGMKDGGASSSEPPPQQVTTQKAADHSNTVDVESKTKS